MKPTVPWCRLWGGGGVSCKSSWGAPGESARHVVAMPPAVRHLPAPTTRFSRSGFDLNFYPPDIFNTTFCPLVQRALRPDGSTNPGGSS